MEGVKSHSKGEHSVAQTIAAPAREHMPSEGTIWKAAGLRVAYCAQHAVYHLQKQMQETPHRAQQV